MQDCRMSKRVDLAKLRSITVSAAATPTRSNAPRVLDVDQRDAQLDKDAAAYRRLRRDGLQPPQVDGSADREARATEKWQVEETPPAWQIEQAGNMGVDVAG